MKNYDKKNAKWGYIMIAPVFLGLLIFYIIPFFQNIFYSFTNLNQFGKWEFVGTNNYIRLFEDPKVFMSLKNTFVYTICTVPLILIFSMIIANLLNQKIKGIGIYRTLYFLPAITMPVATAMIWKWIFNGQYGLLNAFLEKLGIQGQNWISDPKFAMGALIIVGVWMGLGMNIIYFLAGLQSIPKTYYEAATLDHASPVKQFFTITIPSLTPTIVFVLITSFIGAFQIFDLIFLMIGKTSLATNATMSIVYLFYRVAIEFGQKGYGAAIAVMIFLIIMLFTFLQLKLQKRWVQE